MLYVIPECEYLLHSLSLTRLQRAQTSGGRADRTRYAYSGPLCHVLISLGGRI